VLVPNPAHNPNGDFALQGGYVTADGPARHTFSGISVYHPRFFAAVGEGNFSVVPLLQAAMAQHRVTGEFFTGPWHDVGTLERLEGVRKQLEKAPAL
jgi:MurNAc alpha-1-phosphate uridylyltransferase